MRTLLLALGVAVLASCPDDGDDDDDADVVCAEEATCQLCLTCAGTGPCESLSLGCQDDADCRAFYQCFGDGTNEGLIEQCRVDHPGGAELYCADTQCTVYEQCGDICEPSPVCPAL
jgi:hypothetical protein